MKLLNIYIIAALCLGILAVIYLPISQTTASPTDEKIVISTSPESSFIYFENMAPGDSTTKTLTVNNDGNVDFSYSLSATKEAGDKGLYDQLLVTIKAEEEQIFEGNLNDLDKVNIGDIKSFKKEDITFLVELPKYVGNEVKGKSTTVGIKLSATGESTSVPDNSLPKTATNIFNYLFLGIGLLITGIGLYYYQRYRRYS